MSMTVKGKREANFLYLTLEGEFTLDEATRTFGIALDMVVLNHSRKVLFDGRTIVGEPTAVERYYFAAFASETVDLLLMDEWLDEEPRIAFVLKEPVLDPLRLGQIVARKRGLDVKAFDDIDEALRWLKVVPTDATAFLDRPSGTAG
jgi:hypothetical protein